jgi:hypothetical protein
MSQSRSDQTKKSQFPCPVTSVTGVTARLRNLRRTKLHFALLSILFLRIYSSPRIRMDGTSLVV